MSLAPSKMAFGVLLGLLASLPGPAAAESVIPASQVVSRLPPLLPLTGTLPTSTFQADVLRISGAPELKIAPEWNAAADVARWEERLRPAKERPAFLRFVDLSFPPQPPYGDPVRAAVKPGALRAAVWQ